MLWSLGLVLLLRHFNQISHKSTHTIVGKDFWFLGLLAIIFVPLYLVSIYSVPYQINTDEVSIMFFAERLTSGVLEFDPFGLSESFGFPSLIFMIWGWVSKFLGGIDLFHFRLTHALSGLLIILFTYLLCRLFLSPPRSLVVTALVGGNHALLAISRMAMRDNSSLLLEVAALYLLLKGFKHRSLFYVFLGGTVSGLTFYTYFAARFTVFVWIAFLIGAGIFFRHQYTSRFLAKVFIISMLGFILVGLPVTLASVAAPQYLEYPKMQILLFESGRQLQQSWMGAQTEAEGIWINIVHGLTTFNNQLHDRGYIYPNYGHGFVDPLSGVLIWIGLVAVLVRWGRRQLIEPLELLSVIGFLSLWLICTFLVNKSPNYTRLLVILPFVAYLVYEGLRAVGKFLAFILNRWFADNPIIPRATLATFLVLIVGWNFGIFSDFARKGLREGNDVGSTARFVESRKERVGYSFYLAANQQYPYYLWGEDWQWRDWLGFFVADTQRSEVLESLNFENLPERSFTIFMPQAVWFNAGAQLRSRYPTLMVHPMKTDQSLLAIEVP